MKDKPLIKDCENCKFPDIFNEHKNALNSRRVIFQDANANKTGFLATYAVFAQAPYLPYEFKNRTAMELSDTTKLVLEEWKKRNGDTWGAAFGWNAPEDQYVGPLN